MLRKLQCYTLVGRMQRKKYKVEDIIRKAGDFSDAVLGEIEAEQEQESRDEGKNVRI